MKENIYSLIKLIKKDEDELPDYEKIKELTPQILFDWKDINNFLYCLSECDYDISALEAVLLAVEGDVCRRIEGNGFAKAVLFHLYHDGKYEVLIHDRVVKISAPELKSRERYDAFIASDCPVHFMHVGDEDIVPSVYTPDAYDYMMLYLFGTNFGCDADEYPVPELEDLSAQNFDRAIRYMPVFVDYLWTEKLPERGMDRIVDRMEKEGYSSDDVARFCRAWFETIERKNFVCKSLMRMYLFGKCELELNAQNRSFDFADKKDFANAKAFVPTYVSWLYDVFTSKCVNIKDYYDPDLVLKHLAEAMQKSGYSDEDITDFATLWVKEMLKQDKVYYSSMYLFLFGEHFGGTRVNIDGIKNFDAALALIPDYLEYIFDYEGFDDEYAVKFDPDCKLYNLIAAMREHGFGEKCVNTFVTQWVNGVETLQKPCNSPIYMYLFNRFFFKHENFKIELTQNKKDFESALSFIPKWIEYLTDISVQYHNGYGEYDVFDLIICMNKEGYEKARIEKLLDTFLAELNRVLPYEVSCLERNLLWYAEKEPWLNEYLAVFDSYNS